MKYLSLILIGCICAYLYTEYKRPIIIKISIDGVQDAPDYYDTGDPVSLEA